MGSLNLNLSVATVNGNSKEDLLNALRELAGIDADFNGDNGEEYTWEEVKEHNKSLDESDENYFHSNMEFLLNEVKKLDGEMLVMNYIKDWIGSDSYWTAYKYEITKDNEGNIRCISLATLS